MNRFFVSAAMLIALGASVAPRAADAKHYVHDDRDDDRKDGPDLSNAGDLAKDVAERVIEHARKDDHGAHTVGTAATDDANAVKLGGATDDPARLVLHPGRPHDPLLEDIIADVRKNDPELAARMDRELLGSANASELGYGHAGGGIAGAADDVGVAGVRYGAYGDDLAALGAHSSTLATDGAHFSSAGVLGEDAARFGARGVGLAGESAHLAGGLLAKLGAGIAALFAGIAKLFGGGRKND